MSGVKKVPNLSCNVLQFEPRPVRTIPKINRIDTSYMSDQKLTYVCAKVIHASLMKDKDGVVARATADWFITNSTREQLENFVDWIHGGMGEDDANS